MEFENTPGVPLAGPPPILRPSTSSRTPPHAVMAGRPDEAPRVPNPTSLPTYATHGSHHPQTAYHIAAAEREFHQKLRRRARRRHKIYAFLAFCLAAAAVGGWLGFREHIYGDDAPAVDVDR